MGYYQLLKVSRNGLRLSFSWFLDVELDFVTCVQRDIQIGHVPRTSPGYTNSYKNQKLMLWSDPGTRFLLFHYKTWWNSRAGGTDMVVVVRYRKEKKNFMRFTLFWLVGRIIYFFLPFLLFGADWLLTLFSSGYFSRPRIDKNPFLEFFEGKKRGKNFKLWMKVVKLKTRNPVERV